MAFEDFMWNKGFLFINPKKPIDRGRTPLSLSKDRDLLSLIIGVPAEKPVGGVGERR